MLEVGPGTGTLTEALLDAGARVLAVEMDADLVPILRQRLGEAMEAGQLRLIVGDVLASKHTLHPEMLRALRERSDASGGFKLIANLPYQVASPLLVNLATQTDAATDLAIVMVQKEVAQRLAATPDDGKQYGPLSVIIGATHRVETLFTLSPGCFWPRPKVDSAVVRLTRRDAPLTDNLPALAALTHRLFAQRRKQIGTTLGRDVPLPDGITATMRPEQLTIEQLVALGASI